MTMFGRDSIFTSLQALPFTPELAATTLRALGEWQGPPRRRLPRRGSRPDPPRDALRRDDRLRGAAALALLRLRRRDAALRRAARRVRALDRRHEARARARARGARGAELDRRVRRPPGQRLHLVPAPQREDRAREPVLEGLLGLDLVPRRPAARASRARPASSRATPTTRRCAAPGSRALVWKDPAFAEQLEKEAADLKRRFNRDFWVEDGEYFALALDTGRQPGRRAHLEQRPPALERHRRQVEGEGGRAATCSGRGCSRAGACARWPRARAATTRSATTSAPSGPSTTRSSRGACAATASRRRRRRSPPASSTRPSSSTGGCPEAFGGYERSLTKYPVQYPTACSPQAWSTGAPLLLLRTMLGLEPIGDHLVVDPALPDGHRPSRAARHPRPLGPDRRLRARAGRDIEARTRSTRQDGVSMNVRFDIRSRPGRSPSHERSGAGGTGMTNASRGERSEAGGRVRRSSGSPATSRR